MERFEEGKQGDHVRQGRLRAASQPQRRSLQANHTAASSSHGSSGPSGCTHHTAPTTCSQQWPRQTVPSANTNPLPPQHHSSGISLGSTTASYRDCLQQSLGTERSQPATPMCSPSSSPTDVEGLFQGPSPYHTARASVYPLAGSVWHSSSHTSAPQGSAPWPWGQAPNQSRAQGKGARQDSTAR